MKTTTPRSSPPGPDTKGDSRSGTPEPPAAGEPGPEFFRDLCDNAEDIIQSVAPDGRYLYTNRAWHRILGYSREDLRSLRLFDIIHPSCRDKCAEALKGLLHGEPSVRIEAVFKAKDGRRVEVEGAASCRFENDRPVATRGIFRDVTERNSARDQYDRLWNLSLDLLCVAGLDGYFKRINPAFEKVLGYSREELLSRRFVEFVHPEDRAATEKEIVRLSEGKPVVDFQNRYMDATGSYRWLAWRSAPVADRGLIYAVARDITESKRIEELMRSQAAELERSNTDLEQFAYVASHDLRAPLRAIANLADWIEEDFGGAIPEKVKGHMEKLRARLERMEELTSALLDYSRAGTADQRIESVDTALMVGDLATELAPPEGFRILARFGLPRLMTNSTALELVLRNLLSNAVKHHDRSDGQVVVTARRIGDLYEFRVIDDGPGIPQDERDRVFQMFHRLEGKEGVEGTGIGLATAKRIVERLGGRIRVEDGENRGSAFVFTWPMEIAPPGVDGAADPGRR